MQKNLTLLVAIAALCCGALFNVWEQDIYWLIRDGVGILKTGHLPFGDQYSFSAPGGLWLNAYWLSAVIFAVINSIASEAGLVIFRFILVAALLFIVSRISKKSIAHDGASWATEALILPAFFLALFPRVQLRPDFLIVICYALGTLLWRSGFDSRRKLWLSLALCLLAANLHQGASPAVIGYLCFELLLSDLNRRQKTFGIISAILLFFATPNLSHTMAYLGSFDVIVDHDQQAALENLDFGSFKLSRMTFGSVGWAAQMILAWAATTGVVIAMSLRTNQSKRYVARCLFVLALGFLGFMRDRLMPFFLVSSVPFLSMFISGQLARGPSSMNWKALRLVAFVFWIGMVPMQFLFQSHRWGLGVDKSIYPVGSVEFIKQTRPQPNIYHNPVYGNYLLGHLQDYKVFLDSREVPFEIVHRKFAAAFYSETEAPKLMNEYKMNTVLMQSHAIAAKPSGELWDRISEIYNPKEWALVHFDQISMVLVRRISEHEAIIANHEYKFIRPNIPPEASFDKIKDDPAKRVAFEKEAARCLQSEPEQWICLAAGAESAKALGKKNEVESYLERLRAVGEKIGFAHPMRVAIDRLSLGL